MVVTITHWQTAVRLAEARAPRVQAQGHGDVPSYVAGATKLNILT